MMVLYSPDWTNTGFSFILLTVNPFRHSTLTEHGLYIDPGAGGNRKQTTPRGYKTFFKLNSTEHEITTAHKNENTDK